MQCPRCGNFDFRVLKTYEKIEQDVRIRTRICLHCGFQIRTVERIDRSSLKKLKTKDKR